MFEGWAHEVLRVYGDRMRHLDRDRLCSLLGEVCASRVQVQVLPDAVYSSIGGRPYSELMDLGELRATFLRLIEEQHLNPFAFSEDTIRLTLKLHRALCCGCHLVLLKQGGIFANSALKMACFLDSTRLEYCESGEEEAWGRLLEGASVTAGIRRKRVLLALKGAYLQEPSLARDYAALISLLEVPKTLTAE
jgi:hypothetical protein